MFQLSCIGLLFVLSTFLVFQTGLRK